MLPDGTVPVTIAGLQPPCRSYAMARTRFEYWYGRPSAPAPRHTLRAGPLSAVLEGADLRRVRLAASRLRSASTSRFVMRPGIPFRPPIDDWRFDHRRGPLFGQFPGQAPLWGDRLLPGKGTSPATADGMISYAMDGVRRSGLPLLQNRLQRPSSPSWLGRPALSGSDWPMARYAGCCRPVSIPNGWKMGA